MEYYSIFFSLQLLLFNQWSPRIQWASLSLSFSSSVPFSLLPQSLKSVRDHRRQHNQRDEKASRHEKKPGLGRRKTQKHRMKKRTRKRRYCGKNEYGRWKEGRERRKRRRGRVRIGTQGMVTFQSKWSSHGPLIQIGEREREICIEDGECENESFSMKSVNQ